MTGQRLQHLRRHCHDRQRVGIVRIDFERQAARILVHQHALQLRTTGARQDADEIPPEERARLLPEDVAGAGAGTRVRDELGQRELACRQLFGRRLLAERRERRLELLVEGDVGPDARLRNPP